MLGFILNCFIVESTKLPTIFILELDLANLRNRE